jgi:hypothetical protein
MRRIVWLLLCPGWSVRNEWKHRERVSILGRLTSTSPTGRDSRS